MTGVQPSHVVAREEIFGPVLAVMSFRTPEEAILRANNSAYGLAAGVLLCATATAAQESLQAPAQESSRAHDRRAEALMAEGRLDEAREALARALAMEPDNGRALFLSQQLRRAASAPDARLPPLDLAGAPLEAQDFARLTLSGIAAAEKVLGLVLQ